MKKPTIIEAEQIVANVLYPMGPGVVKETQFLLSPEFTALLCIENHDPNARRPPRGFTGVGSTGLPHVHTLHGPVNVRPGDWIARAVDGDVWPIADEQFQKNYEEVKQYRDSTGVLGHVKVADITLPVEAEAKLAGENKGDSQSSEPLRGGGQPT